MLNEDYKEMLQCLSDAGVDLLVVGAFAMAVHGRPRATGDMDLWVVPARDNARKVYAALTRFGAPLDQVDETTFATPGVVFQIGVAPRRIDILLGFERSMRPRPHVLVTPDLIRGPRYTRQTWIPAFAGMTSTENPLHDPFNRQ